MLKNCCHIDNLTVHGSRLFLEFFISLIRNFNLDNFLML